MAERIGMVETTCPTCGTQSFKARSWVKQNKAAYCSRSCRGKAHADHMRAISPLGIAAMTPDVRARAAAHLNGPTNPAWKGGVTHRRRRGNYVSVRYVRCPPDLLSMARADDYVMEHRLVMARWVGRALSRAECVHHIDHDPLNNLRRNLDLWPDNRSHKLAEHGRLAEGAANLWFPPVSGQP